MMKSKPKIPRKLSLKEIKEFVVDKEKGKTVTVGQC